MHVRTYVHTYIHPLRGGFLHKGGGGGGGAKDYLNLFRGERLDLGTHLHFDF